MEQFKFRDGQELFAVYFSDGGTIKVGKRDIDRITVCIEPGGSTDDLWFMVWRDGHPSEKWNGKGVDGVGFRPPEKDEPPVLDCERGPQGPQGPSVRLT